MAHLLPFISAYDPPPPLILDLQGSKWRLGQFPPRELLVGQSIELVYSVSSENPGRLPVPHADFFKAVFQSSPILLLNDAKIKCIVESATDESIRVRVVEGGPIESRKGITYRESEYRQETLNEKDLAIVEMARGWPNLRYAISYVKDAIEMVRYRDLLGQVYMIAKLERRTAINDCLAIAHTADELWLCRGDLGAELGLSAMAQVVYLFSNQVISIPVPVLLAGQVLEHITTQPTPTRSEICYLYEALRKGYRGFVLSDETAVGHYPVAALQAASLFRS